MLATRSVRKNAKTRMLPKRDFATVVPVKASLTENDGAEIAALAPVPGSIVSIRYEAGGALRPTLAPQAVRDICESFREALDPSHKILKGFDVRVYAQGTCTTGEGLPANDPLAVTVPLSDPAAVNTRYVVLLPAPVPAPEGESAAATVAAIVTTSNRAATASRRDLITLSARSTVNNEYMTLDFLISTASAVAINAAGACCLSINFNDEPIGVVPSMVGRREMRFSRNAKGRVILIIDALNSPEGVKMIYQKMEKTVSKVMPSTLVAERVLSLLNREA